MAPGLFSLSGRSWFFLLSFPIGDIFFFNERRLGFTFTKHMKRAPSGTTFSSFQKNSNRDFCWGFLHFMTSSLLFFCTSIASGSKEECVPTESYQEKRERGLRKTRTWRRRRVLDCHDALRRRLHNEQMHVLILIASHGENNHARSWCDDGIDALLVVCE